MTNSCPGHLHQLHPPQHGGFASLAMLDREKASNIVGELYREVFMERVAEGLRMVDDLICRLQVQGEEGEESVNEASKNN